MKYLLLLAMLFLVVVWGCNKQTKEAKRKKHLVPPHYAIHINVRESEGYPFEAIMLTTKQWTGEEYEDEYGMYQMFVQYVMSEKNINNIVRELNEKYSDIVFPKKKVVYTASSVFQITVLSPLTEGKTSGTQDMRKMFLLDGEHMLKFIGVLERYVDGNEVPSLTNKFEKLKTGIKNNAHPVM